MIQKKRRFRKLMKKTKTLEKDLANAQRYQKLAVEKAIANAKREQKLAIVEALAQAKDGNCYAIEMALKKGFKLKESELRNEMTEKTNDLEEALANAKL